MGDTRQVILPITGMTCANCVSTVERNLKKVQGVQQAAVNLSSERATVEFDPNLAGLGDLINRVQKAGYGVATGEADLLIRRMSDDNDARRLEKALQKLDGVLEAQVSLTTEHARVRYIPTVDIASGLPPQVLDANLVTLVETWESLDALRNHLKTPHMAAFFEKRKDMVEGGSSLKVLQEA